VREKKKKNDSTSMPARDSIIGMSSSQMELV
jgi:hypothetical protein